MKNCGCNSGAITNWYGLQNTAPQNPFDLIADAYLNSTQGVFAYSDTFIDPPGGAWIASPITYTAEATCNALETDNNLKNAEAAQWNFKHQTVDISATLAPPMHKVIYLRGGRQWQMQIKLNLGTSTNDLQLSFRDNAGTRGDYAGTIPVITFPGTYSGAVLLDITLNHMGTIPMGLRMIDSGTSDWSMFEMEWVIVP